MEFALVMTILKSALCVAHFRPMGGCGTGRWLDQVLQPLREILLLICCRCSNERSPMQSPIGADGNPGRSRGAYRLSGSGFRRTGSAGCVTIALPPLNAEEGSHEG